MNEKLVKSDQTIQLGPFEKILHYSIVVFLFILPAFTAYDLARAFFLHEILTPREQGIMPSALIFMVIGLIAFFIQKDRLRYRVLEIALTDKQFEAALQATALQLDWSEPMLNQNALVFNGGGKSRITVIKTNHEVLMNSIADPYQNGSIFSEGSNRKNITTLIGNFKKAKTGLDVIERAQEIVEKEEADFWKAREWTFAGTLKRIVGYLLSIGFIALGVFVMIQSGEAKGIVLAIPTIGLPLWYLYADISILLKKRHLGKQSA